MKTLWLDTVTGIVCGVSIVVVFQFAWAASETAYRRHHGDMICRKHFWDGAEVQGEHVDCYIEHPPVYYGLKPDAAVRTAVALSLAEEYELEAYGLQQLKRSQSEQQDNHAPHAAPASTTDDGATEWPDAEGAGEDSGDSDDSVGAITRRDVRGAPLSCDVRLRGHLRGVRGARGSEGTAPAHVRLPAEGDTGQEAAGA